MVIFTPDAKHKLQEFVIPNNIHPLSKRLLAQLGNKHPSTGGLSRSFSSRFDRDLKTWPNKNPSQLAADLTLVTALEDTKLLPEARNLQRVIFSDQNAKIQRSLVSLAHGPMFPNFENSPGLTSLGALALQGKQALHLFSQEPNGKHGRALISPLSFWIGNDPQGHERLPSNLLENQRFVKFRHTQQAYHTKALSESIRAGDRHKWFNDKWQKRNVYSDFYESMVQKTRAR